MRWKRRDSEAEKFAARCILCSFGYLCIWELISRRRELVGYSCEGRRSANRYGRPALSWLRSFPTDDRLSQAGNCHCRASRRGKAVSVCAVTAVELEKAGEKISWSIAASTKSRICSQDELRLSVPNSSIQFKRRPELNCLDYWALRLNWNILGLVWIDVCQTRGTNRSPKTLVSRPSPSEAPKTSHSQPTR